MAKDYFNNIPRILILVYFLLIWELTAQFQIVSSALLVGPSTIVLTGSSIVRGISDVPDFWLNFLTTLYEVVTAFAIVTIVGLALGFSLGIFKGLGKTLEPLLYLWFAIPTIVIYPVVWLTLGIGPESKIVYGAIVGAPPIVVSTLAGVRQVDAGLVKVATSFGARQIHVIYKVIIPAAAPLIFSGIRYGLSLTLIGILAAELLVSINGLGAMISLAGSTFRTAELFSLIFIAVALALTTNFLFWIIERKVRK